MEDGGGFGGGFQGIEGLSSSGGGARGEGGGVDGACMPPPGWRHAGVGAMEGTAPPPGPGLGEACGACIWCRLIAGARKGPGCAQPAAHQEDMHACPCRPHVLPKYSTPAVGSPACLGETKALSDAHTRWQRAAAMRYIVQHSPTPLTRRHSHYSQPVGPYSNVFSRTTGRIQSVTDAFGWWSPTYPKGTAKGNHSRQSSCVRSRAPLSPPPTMCRPDSAQSVFLLAFLLLLAVRGHGVGGASGGAPSRSKSDDSWHRSLHNLNSVMVNNQRLSNLLGPILDYQFWLPEVQLRRGARNGARSW